MPGRECCLIASLKTKAKINKEGQFINSLCPLFFIVFLTLTIGIVFGYTFIGIQAFRVQNFLPHFSQLNMVNSPLAPGKLLIHFHNLKVCVNVESSKCSANEVSME